MIPKKLYIVQELEMWGISEISHHESEKGALASMKALVKKRMSECRVGECLAKPGDFESDHKNGEIYVPDKPYFNDNKALYQAEVFSWYRTSYEYDEHDVAAITYRIVDKELLA